MTGYYYHGGSNYTTSACRNHRRPDQLRCDRYHHCFPFGPDGRKLTPASNPAPTLSSISPTTADVGVQTTITLNNTDSSYVSSSTANFNGSPLATTFVKAATQASTAVIPASDLTATGMAPITVVTPPLVNGGTDGGTSAAQTLTIVNPTPTLTNISPTTAILNTATQVTLTGTGFVAGAKVNDGTSMITPTSFTSTQIVATLPAGDLSTAGMVNITVVNPTPGGGASNALTISGQQPGRRR